MPEEQEDKAKVINEQVTEKVDETIVTTIELSESMKTEIINSLKEKHSEPNATFEVQLLTVVIKKP